MKKLYFIILALFFLLIPITTVAQTEFWPSGRTGWPNIAGSILTLLFGPNIPAAFVESPYTILQWLIFPFLSLWLIIYGILSQIRIFEDNENVHLLLSFLISAMAGPTGGLVYFVRIIFIGYGFFGFSVFVILLFLGTALWGRKRGHDMYDEFYVEKHTRLENRNNLFEPGKKSNEDVKKDIDKIVNSVPTTREGDLIVQKANRLWSQYGIALNMIKTTINKIYRLDPTKKNGKRYKSLGKKLRKEEENLDQIIDEISKLKKKARNVSRNYMKELQNIK